MKNIWLILPVSVIVLFMSFSNTEPMVADSYTYQVFGGLRPFLYPLLFKMFGQYIVVLQGVLWLAVAYIVLHKTNVLGMILYCSTIGLLFLSQKILTETVFVFMITMAVISNKDWSFMWICLTLLVKPVMVFFVPLAYIALRPQNKFQIIGVIMVVSSICSVVMVADSVISNHWQGIWGFFVNVGRNCIGKTVGIESLFWQRVTQLQTLSYVLLGLALPFSKKNLVALLPLYLILISGFAPNQGDRYIIIIAPACLLLFNKLSLSKWKQSLMS